MKIQLFSTAIIASTLILTGCGGSSSSDGETTATTTTGQFIDSAVSGLIFKCSSGNSGITDVSGHFTCNTGDSVEFSINGFVIGSASAGDFITPQTLFPNNTQAQTNLAQFLQTLDSDGNPENGITIDSQSQEAQGLNANLTVDFTQVGFDSVMTSYIGKTLVDEANATAHLNLSLQNLANGAGEVNGYSLVAIVNNAADSSCHRDVEATYDGFADYEAFVNAGGSLNVEYFGATAKQCSQYNAAGYCIEQAIPEGVSGSGNGSCVTVVTFPDSVISNENNTTDTNTSNTVDENPTVNPDEISYEEFTTSYEPLTNLRSDNVYISASVSYVSNTPEYTAINNLYDSTDAQEINFGVYYTIGGGNNLYEVTKTTVTISSDNPYTPEVTLQKEYTDSNGFAQDLGTKTYTEINNLLAGNGTEIKFSKSLANSALQQIYSDYGMDISFDANDRAWFMFSKWSNTNFELVMNESAYLKVKAAFEAKITTASN
ncbi:hypothetical protein [Sulfurimonas sp.]|uniref:hypothetical protein n=1 Tax=Sulfurimonas sp. TaxID=2022749 RepID=UPI003D0B0617